MDPYLTCELSLSALLVALKQTFLRSARWSQVIPLSIKSRRQQHLLSPCLIQASSIITRVLVTFALTSYLPI